MAKGQKTSVNIKPLGDRVLVQIEKEETGKTASGIYIPENSKKEKPEQGMVIAVGDGRYVDDKLVPLSVKTGDTILFSKYGYDEVKVDGEDYIIVKEDHILAVIG